MIVVVCPGQGSQTPGFLAPWLAEPSFADRLAGLSEAAGIDLATHGTESDADTIRDTAVAQPLIVAAGILAFDALTAGSHGSAIGGIAGHSVGEITAAAATGVLDDADAMRFVAARGRAMADAAALVPTGMSAVIGADEADLLGRLDVLGLEPANFNGGGQVVVAGAVEALEQLRAEPPAGARVIPLQVAGAFHTRYMQPARERLAEVASSLSVSDPGVTLWTNRDGSKVASGAEFVDLLVGQVASPVRWDRCMESFAADGVTGLIELAPAGALVGLAKRALKGVPTVAVKTPDDLPAAIELLEQAAA
ncbi:[acyl-carrier-protein] S-malonyltransferase [Agromyces flavus]|uniref:[acyl-carrier-protein] S-malonyltransferase n=1 Tax=Agromyces flavus TaxID=589382 RepID=A0A1H1RUA7_9MICO|nr:ACP S-malonyltransferase [Agromyces flavus]MCP2368885.1 [acyl-carrier-protein] S-malonyltransferase [Agromyces flavus]GGI48342.1 ACP S-malonyltransferase [Agromyces flavus]SDS39126.1 [acyl-carrier-protein] S-malonyltransferase [Agromyces flavus]